MDQYLHGMYYDPDHAASFSSPEKLYKQTLGEGKNYTLQEIKNWLAKQDSYTLHRPVNRKFERNKVVTSGRDNLWDSDLIDFVRFSKFNNGISYILVIIDVFSRFLWLKPLKTRSGPVVQGPRFFLWSPAANTDCYIFLKTSDSLPSDSGHKNCQSCAVFMIIRHQLSLIPYIFG